MISFLNAILYEGEDTIVNLDILDPYQAPRVKGLKDTYLDIKAVLHSGQTVIIEMQVLNTLGFEKRVLYNASKAYSTQLSVGDNYSLLNPIIAVSIVDFEIFANVSKAISSYVFREKDHCTTYSDDIELVFIELPKFTKSLEELETLSDKWIYFLRYANKMQTVPTLMAEVEAIGHAFQVAEQSKLSRKEMDALEKQEMFLHDNRNAILYAEQKAEQKGELKGCKEGEKKAKREIARQLLDVLDMETISLKTGLSLSEIEALR